MEHLGPALGQGVGVETVEAKSLEGMAGKDLDGFRFQP
jgi:hypothetical protein